MNDEVKTLPPDFVPNPNASPSLLFKPLTPELQMMLASLAQIIDNSLNYEDMENKHAAFALFIIPTGKEPNGEAVYLSGSPREEMMLALQLWINKQAVMMAADQNKEAALSDAKPLIDDDERKVLLDRRFDDSNGFAGDDRRKEDA